MFRVYSPSLISIIEKDSDYILFRQCVRSLMKRRINRTKGILRELMLSQSIASMYSMCLRGSYGRGDPNYYSDVDVVLITDANWDITSLTFTQAPCVIQKFELSTRKYPTMPNQHQQRSLSFWLSIPQLSFIMGHILPFGKFISNARETLAAMPLGSLLSMFSDEFNYSDRSNPSSPHFYNLKRGIGGTVEYEFISLLRLWQQSRGCPLSAIQNNLYRTISRYYEYATLLKEYIRQYLGRPIESRQILASLSSIHPLPWFFSSETADRIAFTQHDHVMLYVSLVPSLGGVIPYPEHFVVSTIDKRNP